MNEGSSPTLAFPIRFADIFFAADVPDPAGGNLKTRRVVVVTPDAALATGLPIVVAAVTSSIPPVLTAEFVLLPYKNPPGSRHPKTGLTGRAAVHCRWLMKIEPGSVVGRSGYVPPTTMILVQAKTEAAAKSIGGWP